MAETHGRPWRQLATDWKLWLIVLVALLVATVAWILGYD